MARTVAPEQLGRNAMLTLMLAWTPSIPMAILFVYIQSRSLQEQLAWRSGQGLLAFLSVAVAANVVLQTWATWQAIWAVWKGDRSKRPFVVLAVTALYLFGVWALIKF